MIDLSQVAGFPLMLDPHHCDIQCGDGITFQRDARRCKHMQAVLARPHALDPESELYWNFKLESAGASQPAFDRLHLTFGLVLLPPLQVGGEFVKTHGHYHSAMPGSSIGYPEVYTHFYGEMYLLMQRRANGADDRLDDCAIYKMQPGRSIMVPPGYAHILVNPSMQPAIMAGLYSLDSIHNYDPILKMHGGGYYFCQQPGAASPEPNPRYTCLPALRTLDDLQATRFAPPDDLQPLWSSFVRDPECYRFMKFADEAEKLFLPEDQKI